MSPRIVTFCDEGYIPVAKNWLIALKGINLADRATIVALDEGVRNAFSSKYILYRPISRNQGDLAALWAHRIVVLREFLVAGDAVIHSDADAVWVANPILDIESCGTPIVFSQGTVWPNDIHLRYGLVLCCGFFYLSADESSLRFIDEVIGRIEVDRDDQVAVNRVVAEQIDGWEIDDPYRIPFRESVFLASRNVIRSRRLGATEGLDISILPHHAYPRLLTEVTEETVVAHPLSGKSVGEKEASLSRLGLWLH